MNNLTLGAAGFSYYETLGGGQGACADADGPSAVHVAMSNTLNTPIEALEREFPLRVIEYALRRGSGGAGRHRGGDGVVRELEALTEMTFSLIAERRRHRPAARTAASPARAGAICSTGVRSLRRAPARCSPASGCASKPPAEEDSEMPENDSTERAQPESIGFLGLGIMGSRMAANVARGGLPADGLDAHPRQGRALGLRARRHRVRHAGRGGSAQRHRREHGRRRRAGRRGAARRARRRRGGASGAAVRGHVDDRAARRAPDRSRAARARRGDARRPRDRLLAPRRGGLADDHGRRRARRASSARARCWRRWAG